MQNGALFSWNNTFIFFLPGLIFFFFRLWKKGKSQPITTSSVTHWHQWWIALVLMSHSSWCSVIKPIKNTLKILWPNWQTVHVFNKSIDKPVQVLALECRQWWRAEIVFKLVHHHYGVQFTVQNFIGMMSLKNTFHASIFGNFSLFIRKCVKEAFH